MGVVSMSSANNGFAASRLLLVFIALGTLMLTKNYWLPKASRLPSWYTDYIPSGSLSQDAQEHSECYHQEGADSIMIIYKTGATEIYEKLPMHFSTLLKCVPNFLIYSDLEQEFSGQPIHSAVESVSSEYKDHHEDFELYRQMKEMTKDGQDVSKLRGDKGWNLDKWKFMPMYHTAYEMAPKHIDWFVYIEADTSLSWTNLLQWIRTMDPSKPLYLGAQNMLGDTAFGHGGSGTVVSRAAQEKLALHRELIGKEVYDRKWEDYTSHSCCGDEVIAKAFFEANVPLTPAWPLLQGDKLAFMDFTNGHWCRPAITFHHVTPALVDILWKYQTDWVDEHGWTTPYLHRNVFQDLVEEHVQENKTSWTNLSHDKKIIIPSLMTDDEKREERDWAKWKDYEKKGVDSFEDCGAVCRQDGRDCMQWMWSPGRCYLGRDPRMGEEDERKSGEKWNSGWLPDRIAKRAKSLEDCTPYFLG